MCLLAVTGVFRRLSYNVSLSYKAFYVPKASLITRVVPT